MYKRYVVSCARFPAKLGISISLASKRADSSYVVSRGSYVSDYVLNVSAS